MKQLDWSLYLVTDSKLAGTRPLDDIVAEAILGGVTAVQLREKKTSTKNFLDLALKIKAVTQKAGIPLIINDRVDVALAAGADGVHIGQDDMPYENVRALLGPQAIIGISVTNVQQAQAAASWDVDYLGIGPIFFTNTKEDLKTPIGYQGLKSIAEISSHTLIAIGGIKTSGVEAAIAAGASGVAVVSAIIAAESPQSAAQELRDAVDLSKRQITLNL